MKMSEIIRIIESAEIVPLLYHGTCEDNARNIIENGWQPNSGVRGGNMGQSQYLYLSTGYEDALWFAEEKGCDTVLELHDVPISYLIVDPEDGIKDTVEEELNLPNTSGSPGKVALTRALGPEHFKITKK